MQDGEHLVGTCPFEPNERRTAKRAPSFERFRLLARLAQMRLVAGGEERRLTPEQLALVLRDFGHQKKVSYKSLRRVLGLLARDVGRGVEEREEIARGIEARNKALDKLRQDFRDLLHQEPSRDELLRFELWKEQNAFCLYSGDPIPPASLLASDNAVQVDHILPWMEPVRGRQLRRQDAVHGQGEPRQARPHAVRVVQRGQRHPGMGRVTARVEGCRVMKGRKKRGFYL